MDNELFIKLLSQNSRLIVPEFGAFLAKEQGDSRVVVFTPFLKNDDGVLKKAVSEHFQVDNDDASVIISEFVKEIRNRLTQSGNYNIEGLGTLRHDANGALSFIYEPKSPDVQTKPTVLENNIANETSKSVSEQQIATSPLIQQPAQERPQQSMYTQATSVQPQRAADPIRETQQRPIQPAQETPYQRPEPPVRETTSLSQHQQALRANNPQQPQIARPGAPMPVGGRPIPQPAQRVQPPQPRPSQGPVQGGRPQMPQGSNPNQRPTGNRPPQGRPMSPRKKPPMKADIWLIVAIVAALIVIALMIYGYVVSDPEIVLEPTIENTIDTTTTVNQ